VEGIEMQNIDISKAVTAWPPLAGTIFVPHTEEEYSQLVAFAWIDAPSHLLEVIRLPRRFVL
jgi:hypothetical protein